MKIISFTTTTAYGGEFLFCLILWYPALMHSVVSALIAHTAQLNRPGPYV